MKKKKIYIYIERERKNIYINIKERKNKWIAESEQILVSTTCIQILFQPKIINIALKNKEEEEEEKKM